MTRLPPRLLFSSSRSLPRAFFSAYGLGRVAGPAKPADRPASPPRSKSAGALFFFSAVPIPPPSRYPVFFFSAKFPDLKKMPWGTTEINTARGVPQVMKDANVIGSYLKEK